MALSVTHQFVSAVPDSGPAGAIKPSQWNQTHTITGVANVRVLGRKSAGAGDVEECTLSEVLDFIGSAVQGDILYRGASGWVRLGAGTAGYFLKTNGVGADLSWAAAAGGGEPTYTIVNKGTVSSGTVTFTVSAGAKQKLTVNGALTVAFTGWAAAGFYSEVEIELVNGGTNVTWPTIQWVKGDGTNSTSFSSLGVTLNTVGTNFIVVWSSNAGSTLYGRAA